MPTPAKQYATAKPFYGKAPDNVVSQEDIERLSAYELYEDIYHNRPETFEVTTRGDDDTQVPIYLPSAKKIINAVNRFLATEFDFITDPNSGTPEDRASATRLMKNLFKREKMYVKHNNQRRYWLIRGDAMYHITADDKKEEGSRISIHELDPSQYFPIEDPSQPNRIMGCHLVDKIQDPRTPDDKTKMVARRQTYRRVVDGDGNPTGPITSELTTWEIGKWDDRNLKPDELKPVSTIVPEFTLDAAITTIPVYHMRNNALPNALFGLSEVAGIENLFAAMNQSITDEDMTLVMQGLGMYWTDAAPPMNEDGTQGNYEIGPGQVIEVGDGQHFGRVTGVSSVAPFQEHINSIDEWAKHSVGVPDVAIGKVEVAVAESGISLKMQLAPILANCGEKEQEMLGVYDQMLYDIVYQWFVAFEGLAVEDVTIASVVGDPMPVNREARIQEIMLLITSGLITIGMAQAELSKYGYNFAAGAEQQAIADAKALSLAQNADPFSNRYQQETEEQQQNVNPQGFTAAGTPSTPPVTQAPTNAL